MITINQIATELENILNQTSGNIPSDAKLPFDGLFAVRTEGYVLDHVHDYETGKNFFPVFLGSVTGEFNPIPDLEQVDMEIPVSIYFPVRFKGKMLEMQEFLNKVFVGRAIGFNQGDDGRYGQYAVANISIAELGEITNLDVDQFGNSILKGLNQFISEQYKMPVSCSEPWICLNFSIYLSTMKNALSTSEGATIYGNAYRVFLQYSDWSEYITTDNISVAYATTTETQQGFSINNTYDNDRMGTSFGVTSAVSYTFEAVVKRTAFWKEVLSELFKGELAPNAFELAIRLKDEYKSGEDNDFADFGFEVTQMVCTNITTNFGTNEPLTVQFTFTPLAEVQ